MRIVSIGGGPAGLWFAILMKKARPDAQIRVYERNRPDDTFGWGVVFSKETLGNLAAADPESYREIERHFIYWDNIDNWYRGELRTSTGHGFCGLSRKRLLLILQARAKELGVEITFQHEVPSWEAHADADLVLAVDGVNSKVRGDLQHVFEPNLDWRKCKFAWFGTDLPLDAFTFVFQETQWGLFQVHAYPFEKNLSTWIVECREETWKAAGLDLLGEEPSARFCEEIFAGSLRGHRLLCNRSMWRTFPTIRCKTWRHENVILMGDAAHTAHFSIGSGTKLAMEDSMALVAALAETPDVRTALANYEAKRMPEVIRLQRAAQTSLEWFENSARYLGQEPNQFLFNLMTRSRRITFDNLQKRDPELVRATCATVAGSSTPTPPPPMFLPFTMRGVTLPNRVVVSPMCQYSADEGRVNEWHLVHLGSRAIGGAGLVLTEMTNVCADGRITPGCAGLWADAHTDAWARIVDFVHTHSPARIGIQLAHAGRKGSVKHDWGGADAPLTSGGWQTLGPSATPFRPEWPKPKAMDRADMDRVRDDFVRATIRSKEAGFDLVELHMAHGYLLSSFLSPLSNKRRDEYGGSLENRMRYPLEVFEAVREAWPKSLPLVVRISATDWHPEGFTPEESVVFARMLGSRGCDAIDVSTAGNAIESKVEYGRMYQVPFAEKIRYEAGLPVMTVGGLQGWDHCNTVLAAGRADLVVLARQHLRDPYLTLHASEAYGHKEQWWPPQYWAAR